MEFKKITAIVRSARLSDVEARLRDAGVRGVTITRVAGFGEYANLFASDWLTTHARLELFLPAAQVEEVRQVIAAAAATGVPGDGIIVVLPVERLSHIRDVKGETAPEHRRG